MPKKQSNGVPPQLLDLVRDFGRELANAVESFTARRLKDVKPSRSPRIPRPGKKKRSPALCYYPGCKNLAAPRFGMFCAAKHKNLSAAEKKKYRAQRSASPK